MPTYDFLCDSCRGNWELEQSITEPLPTACPDCGAVEPSFHQDFAGVGQFCFTQPECTTFGQQAERNAKRVGKEIMDKMAEHHDVSNRRARKKMGLKLPAKASRTLDRYKPKRPWWRPDSDKPLDVTKLKDPQKFVLEGKTT